jgi:hypothetical protein
LWKSIAQHAQQQRLKIDAAGREQRELNRPVIRAFAQRKDIVDRV